jgi:predicted RNase H-related nuclease YkuK (DUF458 family)
MKFKNYSGQEVDVVKEIKNKLENGYDYKIYIGSDSKVYKTLKKTVYSTVIVLHKATKGGTIFVSKVEKRRLVTLKERLMNEVWYSLECAYELVNNFSNKNLEIELHIDCNQNKKFESSKYVEELVGFVVGQGFKCLVKPDGFVATKVADKVVR